MAVKKTESDNTTEKKPAKRSDRLFDYLDNILVAKSVDRWKRDIEEPDFKKQFPAFMVLRFLSMNSNADVRSIAVEGHHTLTKMAKSNPEGVYLYLMKQTPRLFTSRTTFLK